MTKIFRAAAALVLALAAAACARTAGHADDFTDEVYTPRYATGLRIQGRPGGESVVITTLSPWQGADSTAATRLLVLRGGEQAPDGFDGQIVDGEAERIVAMSSTHVALLDALGCADRIVGVSGLGFVSTPSVRLRADSVADVGYDAGVDYERIAALNPDVVLLYGVNAKSPMEVKLAELGIPYMYVGDYLEESPLGKAEWMAALAELTGVGNRGRRWFDSIATAYEELKALVPDTLTRPRVILGAPYGDAWFMAGAASYAARIVADAGADYVYRGSDGTESVPVDMEEAYLIASQAQVWLNPGQVRSLADIRTNYPKFADLPPMRTAKVFNNNKRLTPGGGNDYFESGVVNPHLVLRDLISILHPHLLPDTTQWNYYQQLR